MLDPFPHHTFHSPPQHSYTATHNIHNKELNQMCAYLSSAPLLAPCLCLPLLLLPLRHQPCNTHHILSQESEVVAFHNVVDQTTARSTIVRQQSNESSVHLIHYLGKEDLYSTV